MFRGFFILVGATILTEQLLTAAMLVVPAAGCFLAIVIPGRHLSLTVASAFLSLIVAAAWLVCHSAGLISSPVSLTFGSWLVIPSTDSLAVQLSFQADQSQVLLVLAAMIGTLLESIGPACAERRGAADSISLSVVFPLCVLAILTTDLVVLVSVWFLIDCCVFSLCRQAPRIARTSRRMPGTETVLCIASFVLLFAVLMTTSRFGTTGVAEVFTQSNVDYRVDTAVVVSGLSILLFAAAAVRSAFFPAMIWFRNCLEIQPRTAVLIVVVAGVLPGFSLAIRTLPLAEFATEGCNLWATLGVLTCFTASGVALVQRTSAKVSSLLVISTAGLCAAAMATGHPSAGNIAACALLTQVVAVVVLKWHDGQSNRGIAFVIAMIVAVSGISGSNIILSLVEAAIQRPTDADGSAINPPEQFLPVIWWGIVLSQVLWGMAIVRLISCDSAASDTQESRNAAFTMPGRRQVETLFVAIAAGVTLGISILPLGDTASSDPSDSMRLLSFGAATPACLLGVVGAWMLSQANAEVRDRIMTVLESFNRLCRKWFYLEELIHYGVVLPVHIAAVLIEGCDRRILGGTSEDGWKQTPSRLADVLDNQRTLPGIYFGLTGVLVVVGLVWALF